jgi:hypothetical protein
VPSDKGIGMVRSTESDRFVPITSIIPPFQHEQRKRSIAFLAFMSESYTFNYIFIHVTSLLLLDFSSSILF